MGRCVREMGCQSCVVASIVGSYMVAWYRICFLLRFSALIIIIIIIIAAAVVTFHCFFNKVVAVASCILQYQRGGSVTLRYVPDFAA